MMRLFSVKVAYEALRFECLTPCVCRFGFYVGSYGCSTCPFFGGINSRQNYVKCKHPGQKSPGQWSLAV